MCEVKTKTKQKKQKKTRVGVLHCFAEFELNDILNSVTNCDVVFVIREQEVKDLLQNDLLKRYKKTDEHEQQQQAQQRAETQTVVEFSILVIFCVEVSALKQISSYC